MVRSGVKGPSTSSSLTIGNTAPQITSLTLSPTAVDVTTSVVATAIDDRCRW